LNALGLTIVADKLDGSFEGPLHMTLLRPSWSEAIPILSF
jgi:hypothetical protein